MPEFIGQNLLDIVRGSVPLQQLWIVTRVVHPVLLLTAPNQYRMPDARGQVKQVVPANETFHHLLGKAKGASPQHLGGAAIGPTTSSRPKASRVRKLYIRAQNCALNDITLPAPMRSPSTRRLGALKAFYRVEEDKEVTKT